MSLSTRRCNATKLSLGLSTSPVLDTARIRALDMTVARDIRRRGALLSDAAPLAHPERPAQPQEEETRETEQHYEDKDGQ